MITALSGCSVWSEDLNNLLPFYRDTLGLKVGIESPAFVLFGDQKSPGLALGTHSEVKGKNRDGARFMIGLATDDVEGDYQRLKSQGVEFVEGPTKFDAVTIATLKDPEGNYVQLLQFPAQQ